MFDSILRRETLPRRRFGAGVAAGVVAYAGVAALALTAHRGSRGPARDDAAITFVRAAPPAAPPLPTAAARAPPRPKREPEAPRPVLSRPIVAPTRVPEEPPPEREPIAAAEQPVPAGVEGGVAGGVVGGAAGGVAGGAVEAQAGPVEYDERMTPPVKVSGPDPEYTERALEREIQGTMVVRCVVTLEGRVHGCRVLAGLPFMDRAAVEALERRRYRPATLAGRPVEVAYDFKITLRLR